MPLAFSMLLVGKSAFYSHPSVSAPRTFLPHELPQLLQIFPAKTVIPCIPCQQGHILLANGQYLWISQYLALRIQR